MKKYIIKIPYFNKKIGDEVNLSKRQSLFLEIAGFIEVIADKPKVTKKNKETKKNVKSDN